MSNPDAKNRVILYKRRWVILAIFSLISMTNEVIWISLGSVSSIVKSYYQVSYTSMNWLSMIFSLLYVSIALAVYVLNTYGLKVTIIAGALSNTIASCIKLIGYRRNGYVCALIGNAFGGLGGAFLTFIPPTLAATWFGNEERGRASAIGFLMNLLGIALGFLMGSLFVPTSDDYEGEVKHGMFVTLLSQTVLSGMLLIVSFIFIRKAPPTPPSQSEAISRRIQLMKHVLEMPVAFVISEVATQNNITQRAEADNVIEDDGRQKSAAETETGERQVVHVNVIEENSMVIQSTGLLRNWKLLIENLSFHLLLHSYGIYYGLYVSVNTMLNQITMQSFPGNEKLIGIMGCTAILCGMLGLFLSGILIDKTHRYRIMSIVIFSSCAASFILFTVVLKYSGKIELTFACFCIYGFFNAPFLTVGLEYMAEILYPIKESYLSFIMVSVSSIYAFALNFILGSIIEKFGPNIIEYTIAGLFIIGLICISLVREDLKRIKIDMGVMTSI